LDSRARRARCAAWRACPQLQQALLVLGRSFLGFEDLKWHAARVSDAYHRRMIEIEIAAEPTDEIRALVGEFEVAEIHASSTAVAIIAG
jgi:hypothetical protein